MKKSQAIGIIMFTILCVVIAVALFGCGRKDTEDIEKKAKGKYVEQRIDLPARDEERGISLVKNQEGGYKVYTYLSADKSYRAYESSDGTEYTECNATWLNNTLEGREHYVKDVIAGEDGAEYALYFAENRLHLVRTTDGENAEEILPEIFQDQIGIDAARIQENGNIIVCNNLEGKVDIYAADGSKIGSLEQGASSVSDMRIFDYRKGKAITINKGNNGFYIYDVEQEKVLQEISYNDKVSEEGCLSFGTEDDCYYLNSRGLYHMSNNGSTVEMLVDGGSASMGDQSKTIVSMVAGNEQDCYVLYNQDGSGMQLTHYVYDKDADASAEKQLTIYGLEDNKTIRQAVSRFQAANPDVQVNFKTGNQGEGATSTADQIRVLNTELLSGNGADILVLDGMPMNSYIEKGVLEDMTEFYDTLSKDQPLLTNITDSVKKDEKLYAVPARIMVLSVYGAEEQVNAIQGLDSLDKFLQTDSGKDILMATSYEQYIRLLATINYKELFNDSGKTEIEEGKLRELLEITKNLSDAMGVEASTMMEHYMANMAGVSEETIREEIGESALNNLSTNNDLDARTRNQAVVVEAGGSTDMIMACAVINELGIQPQGINGLYLPSGMIGINSSSDNKELAKEFLKMLFSEEVQSLDLGDGFPVNEAALDVWCSKEVSEEDGVCIGVEDADGNEFSALEPSGEQIRVFAEIGKAADTPVQIDDAILEMIIDEGCAYYRGEKSVQDAASAIANKAQTYLAE